MNGIPRYQAFDGPAILSQGFRPFFLGAGLWAVLAVLIWILVLRGEAIVPTVFAPFRWHAHEMLFGFAGAAVAGFVLTAIPNWTGRMPLQGVPLAILFATWLFGRIATATSAVIGGPLAAVVDLSFLAMLLAMVLREIIAGRNWRNLPIPVAITTLLVANLLTQLEANGFAQTGMLGERLALAIFVLLISLIGGRIIPSFTRNWLAKRGGRLVPVPFGRFDVGVLLLVMTGLALWVAMPGTKAAGMALIVAGVLSSARLARWRSWDVLSEPLLWVMHLGYAWAAVGLLMLGTSILYPAAIPYPAGLHALSAGAIGTMTLAVMTRATRGHTGRTLSAGPGTAAIYALVTLAATLRVLAPFAAHQQAGLIMASAIVWIAAFSLFVGVYGPMLLKAER